jgi:hypothetical protein
VHPEMHDAPHDAPTSYEIYPEKPREPGQWTFTRIGLIVAGIVAVAIMVIQSLAITHLSTISGAQATQIHQLYQANSRLAGQVSAQGTQLSQVSAKVADPAVNPSLITCHDLRNMALIAITGASVSSVPGSVNLSQSAVPIPGHCKK